MDMINDIMNIVVPSITCITILVLLPPLLLYRLFLWFAKFLFTENVSAKVVLITGASSGIGEHYKKYQNGRQYISDKHVTYEYAKRGARLALVARRENRLQQVAQTAIYLGCPDVIVIPADVSKVDDCRRFIDKTVNHFGTLDHLVNNAGIATMNLLEELTDVTNAAPVMKSRGKIIVNASAAAWLPVPRLAMYTASKAALISFFETLRTEHRGDIGITIVTPGVTESELTKGRFLSKDGVMVFEKEMRDDQVNSDQIVRVQIILPCLPTMCNTPC
ncbi:hypothetical protein RND81_13G096100 [Saponaria officinalis]|uniref:Uncharacterized protein n=1 Tax=Saponaria officinalis TaxID=3572 RepID=A0AAW1H268_SAPOF